MSPTPVGRQAGRRAGRVVGVLVLASVLALSVWLLLRPPGAGGSPLVGDKLLHAALFLLLGVAGWCSTLPRVGVLAGLVGWAVLSEVLQHAMGLGRTGDPWDVLADLVGLGLTWGGAALLSRGRRPARESVTATP